MSAPAEQVLPLWAEEGSWAVVRRTPEGEALADAYLTTRQALQRLIVQVQVITTPGSTGVTPQALRAEADRLAELLDEPLGKTWTAEYFESRRVLTRVGGCLSRAQAHSERQFIRVEGLDEALSEIRRVVR